jgi:hypothetical protein
MYRPVGLSEDVQAASPSISRNAESCIGTLLGSLAMHRRAERDFLKHETKGESKDGKHRGDLEHRV